MERIVNAFNHSMRALKHLAETERAVQQELAFLILALPVGNFLAPSFGYFLLMLAALVLVLIVEILNTGLEAACNAITRDFRDDIRIAKDCGSLAVLLASILAGGVWLYGIWLRFFV
jgi:diacylglycerol kinase (ATP)